MEKLKVIIFFLFLSSIFFGKTLKELNPVFSKQAGFYDNSFYLELSSSIKDVKIYYTLDGSEPDPRKKNTYLYNKPIKIRTVENEKIVFSNIKTSVFWEPPKRNIFKCVIVRARAYLEENKSKIITKSYFIAPKNKYSFIVISVVTNPENLFDYNKGIYVLGKTFKYDNESSEEFKGNFHQNGKKWERRVHIEFFDKGKLMYADDMGVRIHGGFTASFPLKSLRLYAKSKYGKKKIKYEIFPFLKNNYGKSIREFDKLILRNGGNDFQETFFRDALIQTLVKNMGFDTQAYRPAIHFINGEYWGITNIRERYDADYLYEHYKISKKDSIILKISDNPNDKNHFVVDEGKKEDLYPFLELKNFIVNYNMNIKKNYEYVKKRIDIKNYINYNIAEIFIFNEDWPGNNVRLWRKKGNITNEYGHDGKWRFMLFDTDNSLFLYDHNTIKYAIDGNPNVIFPNPTWSTEMLKNLLENKEFKDQFINTFMDHINTTFSAENTLSIVERFKNIYNKEVIDHIDRWNFPESYEYWLNAINYIKIFFSERPKYIIKYLEDYFRLKKHNFVLEEFKGGYISINSATFYKAKKLTYFEGIPITLTAHSYNGYKFKYWIINERRYENKKIILDPNLIENIKPVFERVK
ncbi:Fn3 associated [Marinitoga hydrogenitolerans DSM 16785]|uniref:Fn3 associated n=1 Tax=Marinitoga hydrogenitolerans (strain DSM 16785 / JCM 12826 / AT1271) TaxID=1122195 RepID=A0A1M4WDU1_MARH1|nr:CotH kinase family protein [Marinitoga hydrogenitolerans]SHE79233.1 Fn3 associated [Marinitoga hydrogenitolerans DSM 16785]